MTIRRNLIAQSEVHVGQEFEGDLTESVFWGADISRSIFRDVNLSDVSITHAMVTNVGIDAFVDRLVVNGVDVTDYVNDRDEWFPLRAMLTPKSSAEMVKSWALLSAEWEKTVALADSLGPDAVTTSVDGQWNLVQTLRHLIFAMDKWFTVPVLGGEFSPSGMPNSGSVDFSFPGLDFSLNPTLEESLALYRTRGEAYAEYIANVDKGSLAKKVMVLENGEHSVLQCLHVPLEEGFWHMRYIRRDLATLAAK